MGSPFGSLSLFKRLVAAVETINVLSCVVV
jgi:hypothetical protein